MIFVLRVLLFVLQLSAFHQRDADEAEQQRVHHRADEPEPVVRDIRRYREGHQIDAPPPDGNQQLRGRALPRAQLTGVGRHHRRRRHTVTFVRCPASRKGRHINNGYNGKTKGSG